jgi:hypothetical protein
VQLAELCKIDQSPGIDLTKDQGNWHSVPRPSWQPLSNGRRCLRTLLRPRRDKIECSGIWPNVRKGLEALQRRAYGLCVVVKPRRATADRDKPTIVRRFQPDIGFERCEIDLAAPIDNDGDLRSKPVLKGQGTYANCFGNRARVQAFVGIVPRKRRILDDEAGLNLNQIVHAGGKTRRTVARKAPELKVPTRRNLDGAVSMHRRQLRQGSKLRR